KRKMNLAFNFLNQVISFSTEIISFRDGHITATVPEFLYKNLDRSYSRVPDPPDVKLRLLFAGEHYSLTYPKIQKFEWELSFDQIAENMNPKNLGGLVVQIGEWISEYADGHRITIFKDVKPASIEEQLIAETGKALYLPSTQGKFPKTDHSPKKRLITEDIFRRYMKSAGTDPKLLDDAVSRFIQAKFDAGFLSDAWVPIQFQEYVVGYIHLWITDEEKKLFDYDVIEAVFQFAGIFAFSLKENGYFEAGRRKNEPFEGKIIDIGVSGVLFAYPHSAISSSLVPDRELEVRIITPKRSIATKARIVRRYRDNNQGYFGCRFLDMAPEDTRFLFEFIYGRPFTDIDATFLAGQV
ncbi:MAG: PilZ domain-containing protein, partial [Treponema sp.]|nr:PilZ domain-containing protein [Treponema sp.]